MDETVNLISMHYYYIVPDLCDHEFDCMLIKVKVLVKFWKH